MKPNNWRIIEKTKDYIMFQCETDKGQITETIPRSLVEHIIRAVKIKIPVRGKID